MVDDDFEFVLKNTEKASQHKWLRTLCALADILSTDEAWGDETYETVQEAYQEIWDRLNSESPEIIEKFIIYKGIPQ